MTARNLIGLFLAILLFGASPLGAEIKKRTLRDGTLDYYNQGPVVPIVPGKKINFTSPYLPLIESISAGEGMDPYLIKCIIKVESNFNPNAVSVAGAMGLMQIMQDIARSYNVKDPLDPEENLRAGIKHFKWLLGYFRGDIPLALAAYHAGVGRVRKRMAVPPIRATVDYVNGILKLYSGQGSAGLEERVKKLYRRIREDGTIDIYGR